MQAEGAGGTVLVLHKGQDRVFGARCFLACALTSYKSSTAAAWCGDPAPLESATLLCLHLLPASRPPPSLLMSPHDRASALKVAAPPSVASVVLRIRHLHMLTQRTDDGFAFSLAQLLTRVPVPCPGGYVAALHARLQHRQEAAPGGRRVLRPGGQPQPQAVKRKGGRGQGGWVADRG